jgi:hypothetical protein
VIFNRAASGLSVPQHLVEHQEVPAEFMRRLQSIFGRDMHVEWNPKKQRWVIEVCARHNGSDQPNEHGFVAHTHLCGRYYAWMVQDDDTKEYMPLCDRVIEKLHEKDTSRKYGTGEAALARFRQESKDFDDAQKARDASLARDVIRHSSRDNRSTMNKFIDLFKRHDVTRPNK